MEIVQTPGLEDTGTVQRVEKELTAVTWRNYGTSSIVEPLVAVGFGAAVYADLPRDTFVAWAAYALLMYLSRIALWLRWKRVSAGPWNHRLWGHVFHAHSFAALMIWMGATVAFLGKLDPHNQALLIAINCGVAGGGTILLSSYRPAMLTNIGGLMATLSVMAFVQAQTSLHVIGFLAIIYGGYLISVGRNHHAAMRVSFRLRFDRAEIISRLETALVAAQEASRSKSAFLANMSHELRTPLNAILGFSEMLKDGKVASECRTRERQYAGHIHDSGQHLLNLVNDILDLSKAEAACIEINDDEVDLHKTVEDCVGLIDPLATKSGVCIQGPALGGGTSSPALMRGDEVRIRQILLNLLSNAVKFSPDGGTVSLTIADGGDGDLKIVVADQGIGMSEEQAEMALQPFVQIEGVYSRSHQGTGLGLPITKTMVELHDGTLEIRSRPGNGTQATVTFPASRRLSPAPVPEAAPPQADRRPAFF